MALSRERVTLSPPRLLHAVEDEIARTLTARAEPSKIIADAGDMRQKLAAQFAPTNRWDLKFANGGLVDIEFIAQTLELSAAPTKVGVLDTNTIAAIEKLGAAGLLAAQDAKTLVAAATMQHALTQALRIALDGTLFLEYLDNIDHLLSYKALCLRGGRGSASHPLFGVNTVGLRQPSKPIYRLGPPERLLCQLRAESSV